jgi:hypothetical protein
MEKDMIHGMEILVLVAVGVGGFVLGFTVRRAQYKSLYGFNTGLMRYYERTFSQLQDRTIERDQLAAQLRDLHEIEAKRAEADRVAGGEDAGE